MADPISNLPGNAQGQGLALGRAGNPLETVVDFLRPGGGLQQAINDALSSGALQQGELEGSRLTELIQQLPPGHQRQLVESADSLPPGFRDAMQQLGLAPAEPRGRADGFNAASLQGDGAPVAGAARGEAAAFATGREVASAPTTATAGSAAVQSAATPQAALAAQGARPAGEAATLRPGEAPALIRADATLAARAPDRPAAAQPQAALPAQAVLSPQGRGDALPAHLLPAATGATLLANPQAVAAPGHTAASAPPGMDAGSVPVREGPLAPAGHTLAGSFRDRLRRGAPMPRGRPLDWLLTLLPLRDKRRQERDESLSFQWLFWILTVVAYGAVAIAVVSLIPGGRGLGDGFGRPSPAGYALIVGAIAAVASWWVGRRLSKR